MNVKVSEYTIRIFIITLHERIDAFSAPALRQQIEELFEQGITNLVIDLAQVPFFDSAALAVLVTALKKARRSGGDVKLVWPRLAAAQRVIHLTKFDRIFDIADSAEEARNAFRRAG